MRAIPFMEAKDEKRPKMNEDDASWYAGLYTKYMEPVYRYVWRRVGRSREVAEDVVQETFLRVWRYLPFLAKKSVNLPAYLYRTAHNLVVSYYRKKKTLPLEEAADVPVSLNIRDVIESRLDIEKLWERVVHLPIIDQKILFLRYREEFSIKEIAEKLGKSDNAVKIILSRARKNLTEKMKEGKGTFS